MKLVKYSILFSVVTAIIVSCGEQSNLDKLKSKRANLKSEIAALDAEIRELDTVKVGYLPLVKTGIVKKDTFINNVIVQGEVKTDKEIMVNAEANGVIRSINVSEGDFVKKGQTLAQIDTEILSSNIREIETRIEFAEYAYKKQKELNERGVGTEFELEQASNQLNTLKSQLDAIKTQRSKTTVSAPFSGFVDEIFTFEGEMAGAQSPLLRLVNNDEVKLIANISEHYYTRIKEGTPIKAFIPSLSDTINLKVSSVGNYIHPTNRTFRIQALIDDNKLLLPNMLAELHITNLTIPDATIVPSTSILKSQQNEDYIFVVEDVKGQLQVRKQLVRVISRHRGQTAVEVINGTLSEGIKVVTEGGRGVTNNDAVRTL